MGSLPVPAYAPFQLRGAARWIAGAGAGSHGSVHPRRLVDGRQLGAAPRRALPGEGRGAGAHRGYAAHDGGQGDGLARDDPAPAGGAPVRPLEDARHRILRRAGGQAEPLPRRRSRKPRARPEVLAGDGRTPRTNH